jgi:hypothetical protein
LGTTRYEVPAITRDLAAGPSVHRTIWTNGEVPEHSVVSEVADVPRHGAELEKGWARCPSYDLFEDVRHSLVGDAYGFGFGFDLYIAFKGRQADQTSDDGCVGGRKNAELFLDRSQEGKNSSRCCGCKTRSGGDGLVAELYSELVGPLDSVDR